MPSGIEGHRVEASENNVDNNVWTKMKQNDSEFKYSRWVDGTIGIKLWEGKIWEKQVWKIRENWWKICGWVQAAKLVVQLTFAAPSQFDYAGNRPTNQGQSWFLRKIFIASLQRVAFHQTTTDFRQLPVSFLILANSIKAHGNSFSRPYRQNQPKQNLLDRGVQ